MLVKISSRSLSSSITRSNSLFTFPFLYSILALTTNFIASLLNFEYFQFVAIPSGFYAVHNYSLIFKESSLYLRTGSSASSRTTTPSPLSTKEARTSIKLEKKSASITSSRLILCVSSMSSLAVRGRQERESAIVFLSLGT